MLIPNFIFKFSNNTRNFTSHSQVFIYILSSKKATQCINLYRIRQATAKSFFNVQLNPALTAAVIVAVAGILGVIIGVILVQRGWNRKGMLIFSGFGTAVAFLSLCLYFYYNTDGKPDIRIWDKHIFVKSDKIIFLLAPKEIKYDVIFNALLS